ATTNFYKLMQTMDVLKSKETRFPIEFTIPALGTGSFYIQEDTREDFYRHYHRHEEIQITYILNGRGSVVIGNLIQPFFENEIYILKANDPHIFIKEGAQHERIHVIHIFVAFEKLQALFKLQEITEIRTFFSSLASSKKLSPLRSDTCLPFFRALMKHDGLIKLVSVLEIFNFLARNEPHTTSLVSGLHDAHLSDKVCVRIDTLPRHALERHNRGIGSDEAARLIRMTCSAFRKYFKNHTMEPYVTFLNEIRIEKACQLLM